MFRRFEITAGAAIFYPALYFFDSAGWFSALLPAVIAHEAGHVLALRCCGAGIQSLRLEITGLCMDCSHIYDPRQDALCAAAGPTAGMLWSIIAGLFPGSWAQMSSRLSLGLSLFNLLPVMPLDGGRILLALCGKESIVRLCSRLIPCVWAFIAIGLRQWHWLAPAVILLACYLRS